MSNVLVPALRGVGFDVKKELLTVFGQRDSAKSTRQYLIGELARLDEGEVLIDNSDA